MQDYGLQFIDRIKKLLEDIENTQYNKIILAAEKLADSIKNEKSMFVFGCGHAGIISEELFYRAGGFATINPIFNPILMLNTRPVTMTTKAERIRGLGNAIIKESPIKDGDLLLIHSVSGRNELVIDVTLEAKKKGAYIIAITNLESSREVDSRHSSGYKLYELTDLVIDNCGDFGDSAIKLKGLNQNVGATSTIAATTIVNAMVVKAAEILISMGIEPPIFRSANIEGGAEFNEKILEENKDRILYM